MAIDTRPLWLCVDPGETTGFSLWDADGKLVWAEQLPMWEFIDAVYAWAAGRDGNWIAKVPVALLPESTGYTRDHNLGAVVCEDWKLYPWELENLAWDKCRTARAIGALTLICREFGHGLTFQGADIKEGAKQAGAEALYIEPINENRHANDSIQHGVFYLALNGGPPK
jgi:hypothetical protein